MGHSIEFFRDEVRNGFYIPTAIKQAWAACLDVLAEIDRICKKCGIKYFADWGTFLGAVRHGGFVPWDDDLDICMLRDDYTRFREVADGELPDEYVIHDYERKQDHWLFLSRVVNNSQMCFDRDYLNEHNNFPWLAGVDIFVKDYLYRDDEEEVRRDKEIMNILAVADGLTEGKIGRQSVNASISEIENRYSVRIAHRGSDRDIAVALYRLAEQQMAKVEPDESDRVGQIFPWILKSGPKSGEKKEYYEKIIRLPFEDTTIPVPAAYNIVLSRRYGNYCEIRKVWDAHVYPYFEGQKADIEQLSGVKYDRFIFDRKMLNRPDPDRSNSLKTIAKECLRELEALLDDALKALCNGLHDDFEQLIADSQQLAADLGTLIERVKGEDRDCTKRVIEALQEYCDVLWEEYTEYNGNGCRQQGADETLLSKSRKSLDRVLNTVNINIIDRREILFLPIGAREWRSLQPYFRMMSGGADLSTDDGDDRIDNDDLLKRSTISVRDDKKTEIDIDIKSEIDIYVAPLPLMRKTILGEVTMTDEEIQEAVHLEDYPDDISYMITDWTTYDLALHCPDEIYIQNPYDGVNPLLTVPPAFYAVNLRKYAEKIIYVPAFRTAEFGSDDITDIYNLRHYVTAPGIIYSDEMRVWSENIKEQYVNALTAFAGEDTEDIWRERINVVDITEDGGTGGYADNCKKDQAEAGADDHSDDRNEGCGHPNDRKEDHNQANELTEEPCNKGTKKSKKKKMLYCIGANELTEYADTLSEAVNNRLEIFKEAKNSIHLTIALYPGDRKLWRDVDVGQAEKLFGILDKEVLGTGYELMAYSLREADDVASEYDAYYGSPSPFVPAFVTKKKPVMLSNYGI